MYNYVYELTSPAYPMKHRNETAHVKIRFAPSSGNLSRRGSGPVCHNTSHARLKDSSC